MTATSAEYFPSRKLALEWLNANGYPVSQGKFYQDCKAGYPTLLPDKSVSKFQVLEYGVSLVGKTQIDTKKVVDDSEYRQRKEKAEAKIAEMKAEAMEREQSSLWLHADEAWAALAGVIGNLKDSIRHQLYSARANIVHTAGGELERDHETFELVWSLVGKAFNEVAGESVEVKFEKREK